VAPDEVANPISPFLKECGFAPAAWKLNSCSSGKDFQVSGCPTGTVNFVWIFNALNYFFMFWLSCGWLCFASLMIGNALHVSAD